MTKFLIAVSALLLSAAFSLPAQQHPDPSLPSDGALLDSVKYYIRMVPGDTAAAERMPTTEPERFDQVDHPPILVEKVDPVYPELHGEKRRPSGTVWLRCRIETDGSVGKVVVVRSDGEILNAPAIAAVRRWKFTPASNHGKPVAVWVALPVRAGPR